jgi:hypothetical protein
MERRDSIDEPNWDGILEQFRVNSLGPLRVSHALLAADRYDHNVVPHDGHGHVQSILV